MNKSSIKLDEMERSNNELVKVFLPSENKKTVEK